MKWLVTGGAGFIGSSLVRKLASSGEQVRVIDNLKVGSIDSLAALDLAVIDEPVHGAREWAKTALVQVFVADILDVEAVMALTQGADVVVHLAANTGVPASVENPRVDCTTNVIGTFNMLEAARHAQVGRFIFASSGAPVGEVEPPIHEEVVPHPVSPYGASKLCGEAYCSAYFRTYGLETVALRFGNVYGPGSVHKSSVVARFILMLLKGDPLTVYGDGSQTRDFIFVADLLNAIHAAAVVPQVGGEIFQIATARETSVSELVDKLFAVAGNHALPLPEVIYSVQRRGDVLRNFSDTSKAASVLGWRAEVGLADGLSETLAWFLEQRRYSRQVAMKPRT